VSADRPELLLKGSHLCEQSMASIGQAEAAILRCNNLLERSRFVLRQHAKRRAATSLLPGIRLRLQDGRLPHDGCPITPGHPGVGGLCDACNKLLLTKQLVMDIRSGDHACVHLHAGCYILWNAERYKTRRTA